MDDVISRIAARWLQSRKMQPIPSKNFADSLRKKFFPSGAFRLSPMVEIVPREVSADSDSDDQLYFDAIVAYGGYAERSQNKETEEALKEFRKQIEVHSAHRGWFVDVWGTDNFPILAITFEKNYSKQVPGGTYVYRLSDANHMSKILKEGLKPASKRTDFTYPDRVYVFRTFQDLKDGLEFNRQAWKEGVRTLSRTRDVVVLKIDTAKLRPGTKFMVDRDWRVGRPNAALWTYSHIPPEAISVHSKHKMPATNPTTGEPMDLDDLLQQMFGR